MVIPLDHYDFFTIELQFLRIIIYNFPFKIQFLWINLCIYSIMDITFFSYGSLQKNSPEKNA